MLVLIAQVGCGGGSSGSAIEDGEFQLDAFGSNDFQRLFRFRDSAADPTIDGYYSASGMQTDYVTSYKHENNASSVYQHLYEIRVELASIGRAEAAGVRISWGRSYSLAEHDRSAMQPSRPLRCLVSSI